MENTEISFTMDERSVRALHSAVVWTLDKWTGQGNIDQEQLLNIRHQLQACVFEFDFDMPFG